MRILHTSDWHVGKRIRGNSRADEHRAVLGEIADLTRANDVDVVVVAGDVFETAAPTPESEQIVWSALLDLADAARHVVMIAGNHDNARRLSALVPVLGLGGIRLVAEVTRPADGGTIELDIDGESLRIGLLPFVSRRGIVRADELMSAPAFEHAATYADRVRALLDVLCAGFTPDSVNLVVAHVFAHGAQAGGGERSAHLAEEYGIPSQFFPTTASYVALGHLHRPQRIPGPTAIHYCGSPLQLDFGEEDQAKQVNLVEVDPGAPASVTPLRLTSGRSLRTLRGTFDELVEIEPGDDWLRVHVHEPRRSDLAAEIRRLLGERVVDVVIAAEPTDHRESTPRSLGRDPLELFRTYLDDRTIEDPRLTSLFADLLDAQLGTD